MVRSRIEEKVKNNNDRTEAGTVYLTFMVDANGNLRASQIIAEKTTGNQHLQDIALKEPQRRQPFPTVPQRHDPPGILPQHRSPISNR